MAGLRKAGQDQEIPRGLLARAVLHRLQDNPEAARADLAAQRLQFQKLTSRYPAEEAETALQRMLAARAAE